MNYTQPYPQDEDYFVEGLQTNAYNDLALQLGVDKTLWNSFGRTYRDNVTNGYIYEAFYEGNYTDSSGSSTQGGMFFESGKMVSFFGQYDPVKMIKGGYSLSKLEWIWCVDLSLINIPNITGTNQRIDAIVMSIVKNYVQQHGFGFNLIDATRDVDKVFERVSGAAKRNSITRNMQPLFCFKLIGEIIYNANLYLNQPVQQLLPMQQNIVLFIKTTPDPTKVIPVGNGLFIYQEYAEGNNVTPLTTLGQPFLQGLQVTFLSVNNTQDSLAFEVGSTPTAINGAYSNGTYTGNTSGDPYALNDGTFIFIQFTNLI